MRLRLLRPGFRSCESCLKWLHEDQPGKKPPVWGDVLKRFGQPVARPEGSPTPCWACPKTDDGGQVRTPEVGRQTELTRKNEAMLQEFYRMNGQPSDELQRLKFGLIRQMLDEFHRGQLRQLVELTAATLGAPR